MSKNLFRKGLAIGAAVALGLSALVAMPAQALVVDATKVTLTPTTGTGTNVLAVDGATFSLTSLVASSVRGASTTGLKWLVKDTSSLLTSTPTKDTPAADGSFVVDASNDDSGTLVLAMADAPTSTYSVEVTAWFDDLADDVIGAGETGNTVTVNFYAASAVSSSVVVTKPIIGDPSFSGYVVTNPVLNYAQVDPADITVEFTIQGNSGTHDATVSYDSTDKRFEFVADEVIVEDSETITAEWTGDMTADASGDITVAPKTGAQLTAWQLIDQYVSVGDEVIVSAFTGKAGPDVGDPNHVNGTRSLVTVTSTNFKLDTVAVSGKKFDKANGSVEFTFNRPETITVIAGTYSATPYVVSTAGTTNTFVVSTPVATDGYSVVSSSANVRVVGNESDAVTATVRSGVKTVSGSMYFVDADDNPVAAGKSVRVTITGAATKLNGAAFTSPVDVVTSAGGKVDFTLEGPGLDLDTTTITGVAEGEPNTSSSVTFNWADAVYSLVVANSSLTSGDSVSIVSGGSYTFNFLAVDQWAATPTTGSYRLNVALTGNTVSTSNVTMTNGAASVTVTDNKLASGNVNVSVILQKLTGSTWGPVETDTYTLVPGVQTGAAITVNSPAAVPSSTSTLVAGDSRTTQAAVTTTGPVTITGFVRDAVTEVARVGAVVTVSGPSNVLFTDGTRSAFGSLTVVSGALGAYTVYAVSNIAQTDSVITVVSQGGSKTTKVTFQKATETAGTAFTISAPKSIKAGRTLVLSAVLKDKFGNAVDSNQSDGATDSAVEVEYDGPGFIISDLPEETNSMGALSIRLLLGTNETGPALFTVTYGGADRVVGTGSDDVSATSATWVGPIANASAGAKKGVVVVDIYRAKGQSYTVLVGGKVVARGVANAANYTTRVTGVKSGARNVVVRLKGGTNFSGAITVK